MSREDLNLNVYKVGFMVVGGFFSPKYTAVCFIDRGLSLEN